MKRVFICFILVLYSALTFAQETKEYKIAWDKIDKLITKDGLDETAAREIKQLYLQAKKQDNEVQIIKALLYQQFLLSRKDDNGLLKSIKEFEQEIPLLNPASKSVVQSITAEGYKMYFERNRWKLYNRTNLSVLSADPETWSIQQLHDTIGNLYLLSVSNLVTQTINIRSFNPILIKGNSEKLRPTLYDLLSHRALEYFKNEERLLARPAYAFAIRDTMAYAPVDQFVKYKFDSPDTSSLHLQALKLYQQLLQFHGNDKDPSALIDADLQRLQFVHQHAEIPGKEKFYLNSLTRMADKYQDNQLVNDVLLEMAIFYTNEGAQYNPLTDTSNRNSLVKAVRILRKIITNGGDTIAVRNATYHLNNLLRPETNLTLEQVNVPNMPFRMLIAYKNIPQAYFRIVRIPFQNRSAIALRFDENNKERLFRLKPVAEFNSPLPVTNDYQMHKVEVPVNGLPPGSYAIISSASATFKGGDSSILSYSYFSVSDLAYVYNNHDFFVLNRQSGQAVNNAVIQLWSRTYDNAKNQYVLSKNKNYRTSKTGFAHLNLPENSYNWILQVIDKGDTLMLDEGLNVYRPYHDREVDDYDNATEFEEKHRRVFLFTDRAIYRPLQAIYFKGIVLTKDFKSKKWKIVPGMKTTVYLQDMNGRQDSMQVTTNSYGSYNGKFELKSGLLNGSFNISDLNAEGGAEISVEEYKRPTFYVEFEKPASYFRLNDTVKIAASVNAYTGNKLGNTQVVYRVTRNGRYIFPIYGRKIFPQTRNQEIAYGTTTTNADGRFVIRFPAIPDESSQYTEDAVFDYTVTADITSTNGETRSSETTISVGMKSLQIVIGPLAEEMPADSLRTIFIRTENLQGDYLPAQINTSIFKLEAPSRLIRDRLWEQPDQFIMSEAEYIKLFPVDEYSDERNKEKWNKSSTIFTQSDSSTQDFKINLSGKKFSAGWYLLEVKGIDSFGKETVSRKYFELLDTKTGRPATPKYQWNKDHYQYGKVGEEIPLTIGSSANNVYVISTTELLDNKTGAINISGDYDFIRLNNESKRTKIKIDGNIEPGYSQMQVFIKDNRVYTSRNVITVLFPERALNISYTSFRDKTLPGSKESWKIHVSGEKSDQFAAEVVTAMYDKSLDQFVKHQWNIPSLYNDAIPQNNWRSNGFGTVASTPINGFPQIDMYIKTYDRIGINIFSELYGQGEYSERIVVRGMSSVDASSKLQSAAIESKAEEVSDQLSDTIINPSKPEVPVEVQVRSNFNETAFFFPEMETDSAGNVTLSFTTPDAVTTWKWMTLAHTKDLAFAYSEKEIITRKELMVQPNAPRFLREGDRMDFSARITNLSSRELTGQVELQFIDPTTNTSVDGWFRNMFPNQYFTAGAGESIPVSFTIEVPYLYAKPVLYKIIVRSDSLNDGEQAMIPVLSDRILVTESIALPVKKPGKKQFTFPNLLNSDSSETISHHSLTVEFTSNPVWYVVQALPYLKESSCDCSDQIFNTYYANALAVKVASSIPGFASLLKSWKSNDSSLLSNLEKNPELKDILLKETPWVLEASNETERKQQLLNLFDTLRLQQERSNALTQLEKLQLANGAFPWISGGQDDRYITQKILTGIGRLMKSGAINNADSLRIKAIAQKALTYTDSKLVEQYKKLKPATRNASSIESTELQYLYMRSLFPGATINGDLFIAYNFYRNLSKQQWIKLPIYLQGMTAISLYRTGDIQTAKKIMASLKERAVKDPELGMYWKNPSGYRWYQAPIETHSLLIEAFAEITGDRNTLTELKTWLVKNKQTNSWATNSATADAVYAMLLNSGEWTKSVIETKIQLGDKMIPSGNNTPEAGTGYFRERIEGKDVEPAMGTIDVFVKTNGNSNTNEPAWGAVYWQYFENLANIKASQTPLQLKKDLFTSVNTDRGPELKQLKDGEFLKTGDKLVVRIELRVDREMEYVYMKDMRASALEPVNVISSFKWQGGLGYYESTKDASTDFFFSYLPKGTYVFEYSMFVTHSGTYQNGITTISSMYAPEFRSNSEAIRINVEGN